jgi:very-short-patch-repair endonuclease
MSIFRARCVRSNLTEAERLLWSRLRRNRLDGHHVRRQGQSARTPWISFALHPLIIANRMSMAGPPVK